MMQVGVETCVGESVFYDPGARDKVDKLAWAALVRDYSTVVFQEITEEFIPDGCTNLEDGHYHRSTFGVVPE